MSRLEVRTELFATRQPFVIARAVKTEVQVLVARVHGGGVVGSGEGTTLDYKGDTPDAALRVLEHAAGAVAAGMGRDELARSMAPGAARNALDCALWQSDARLAGTHVWRMIGGHPPRACVTALTLSLAEPELMAVEASRVAARPLLKLKLGGDGGDRDRVTAVRAAAPTARLIVDANGAWGSLDIEAEAAALAALGVELIEQPLPAGEDAALGGMRPAIPLCADESCHTRADLDQVVGRYGAINIKLDKAGGLTEALALSSEARTRGLKVMVGCMLSTSLAAAPALLVAQQADWIDLDGPLLLAIDRPGGLVYTPDGMVAPGTLWE